MKWLASWLGTAYSRLYAEHRARDFSIDDAAATLGMRKEIVRVVLSKLAEEGYLSRTVRGKYRATPPEEVVLRVAGVLRGLDGVRQHDYIPLISRFVSGVLRKYDERVVSIVLFGSVARGCAHDASDIDFLLVIRGLPLSFLRRAEELAELLEEIRETKLRLWKEKRIYANIQALPFTPEEAERLRPLYLDIAHDSIVLLDKGGFMERVLERMRREMEKLGARRVTLPSGRWYWTLKPLAKFDAG